MPDTKLDLKSASRLSYSLCLYDTRVGAILYLSAPGALKFVEPDALSFKELSSVADIMLLLILNPIL